jgi:hypothetical protein
MRYRMLASATLLTLWVGWPFLPAHAVEEKRPAGEKARTTKPPTHVEVYGKRVPVVPPGQTRMKGAARTLTRDVSVVGLSVAGTVRANEPFLVGFYVRNNGAAVIAQVPYRVGVAFFLPPFQSGAHTLAEGVARDIGPGRDVHVTQSVTIRSGLPDFGVGLPILVVMVDPDEVMNEEDEDNNAVGTVVDVVASGD